MAPIPAEYQVDFWNQITSELTECHTIELTCLMPNGIILLLKENYDACLAEIKEDVFEEASRMPLSGKLKNMSEYHFKIINSMAEEEELFDENRRLCEVRPVGAVLIITECRGNSIDHSINSAIGHLIGKALQDFDALNSSEINEFRFKMRKLGDEIAQKRNKATWLERLYYQFPPRIADNSYIMMEALRDKKPISVTTICEDHSDYAADSDIMQSSFKFFVLPTQTTLELIEMVIQKRVNSLNKKNEKTTDYVLKVCGRDEYLVGDYQIIQFEYIQECISKDIVPQLLAAHVDRIPVVNTSDYEDIDPADTKKRTSSYNSSNTLRRKKNPTSWGISEKYSLSISTVSKLNCDSKKLTEAGIQVGLFHGGKPLCQPLRTPEKLVVEVNDQLQVTFDVLLEFDIQVCNIPRNAKVCFVVYEMNKYVKGTKTRKQPKDVKENQMNPIAWANTSVFDFKGQLKTGAMTLYMWTYAEDMLSDEVLHPLGTVVSNPNTDYCTALTLNFTRYGHDQNCTFPSIQQILEYASHLENDQLNLDNLNLSQETTDSCKKMLAEMENFYDLHDQDRKNIWSHKHYWMKNMSEVLPKLLSCIDWDKRDEVCQVISLLREWPTLPLEKSLELLDYAFADQEVRSFAVKCLQDVSDEDLQLYLLQLVQAIKHELYLECDLVKFLIQRALNNQKIGHFLFWHLRSEMQVASVSVRFGLILEAYCRGSQEHMPILQKQLQCIEKLKKCSERIRDTKDKEKAKIMMREFLNNTLETQGVRSPLDPSFRCSKIIVEESRVMDSKMRPLRLAFENSDPYGDDIFIIFKNGDDLRQDMLTLQMLKIMDRLWKREGLDLRINAYNCISLEYRVGLIEVVLYADTIANIQKDKGVLAATAAFGKGNILAWLKDYNTTEAALNKAINEFTLSCAGYCVATYVLGIADRHSDNIMVKKNGQLFHIDFGHILGHFKEKFGIKRERVPFVLTHDFVYVINKGQKSTALEFKIFQEYCEKAFMILRKHGELILSLFAMMISTGLPELSSEKDLQYLRETLVLYKTDEEALSHFRAKFDEALSNSWKTSLNWASHNLSKNNKA